MPAKPDSRAPESPEELNARSIRLMEGVAEQNERNFEELIELHQSAVIGTVAKMLGNANEAEDVAQQVFVRVWKSAARYQPTAKFTTWLFTITRNLVFNEMRKRKRRKESSIEEAEENYSATIPDDPTRQPDAETLEGELSKKIDEAIQSLPEKQRIAVVMRRFEKLPYEEIGKVLDLSLPAVKSLLFRARAQLREKLQPYLDE